MPLIEDKEIKELYDLKHRNDNYPKGYNYFNTVLKNSITPFLYNNSNVASFLNYLEPIIAHMFDSVNIVRNWKNWYVDKYKNDHVK